MPDPNTESRLITLERSIDQLRVSFQQLVTIQEELKEIGKHTVELLSNNRYIGNRVEIAERVIERLANCNQELQIKFAKLETQMFGVWKIVLVINGVAMAVFVWALNKFGG